VPDLRELLDKATPLPYWPSLVLASGDVTVRTSEGNRPVARLSVFDREGLVADPEELVRDDAALIVELERKEQA